MVRSRVGGWTSIAVLLRVGFTLWADGIAEIVMDNPPVNALTVAGWFELADRLATLGQDERVRVVVLRAERYALSTVRSLPLLRLITR